MVTVRRVYIFLVCAVSLVGIVTSINMLVIGLLPSRNSPPVGYFAMQIAFVVVCLPFFLVHWIWAERLARSDEEERGSILRRFYLYGMFAFFLAGALTEFYGILSSVLRLLLREMPQYPGYYFDPPTTERILQASTASFLIFGFVSVLHLLLIRRDTKAVPDTGNLAGVRRFFVLAFSAAGLAVLSFSVITALMWVVHHIIIRPGVDSTATGLSDGIARLIIGLLLWLIFWIQAQILFHGDKAEEQESALRKVYLYLVVLTAALAAVGILTYIVADLLRRLFALPSNVDLRDPPLIFLVAAVVWVYHRLVLVDDEKHAGAMPQQALIRRIYQYLIAAIGLAAFLIGLAGDVSTLISALTGPVFGSGWKEQLAYFTAGVIVGLPVWLIPWRSAQNAALAPAPEGTGERLSLVRKLYLYFYLLVASLTVLGSCAYILSRVLSIVLGEPVKGNLVADLAQPIAFSFIGVGVWLIHGLALRGDGRINQGERMERLGSIRVAVVDGAEGQWGCSLLQALKRELPTLGVFPVGLTPAAATAMGAGAPESAEASIKETRIIVEPWNAAMGQAGSPVALAVAESPARKFLVPLPAEGWDWIGVETATPGALVQETVNAIKQVIEGQDKTSHRNPWSVVGIVLAALLALCVLVPLVISVLSRLYGMF